MTEPTTPLQWTAMPFWNRDEHRLRALWRIVAFGLVSWGLGRLALAAHLIRRGNPDLLAFQTLMRFALLMLGLWITARLFERRRFADTGFQMDPPFWREFRIGLLLGALLMAGIFAIELGLGWIAITGFFRSGAAGGPFALAFVTPLVVFICVGIQEEAVARGLLMRTLGEGLSSRWISARNALILACVISSALFGFGHWSNPGATLVSTLNIAVAGAFLALPYLLTGRLGMSIGLHMTWNLFQGNVFGFPVSGTTSLETTVIAIRQLGPVVWTGGTFGPEAGILGLLAMGVGSIGVFVALRDGQGHADIQESLAAPPVRPAPPPTPLPPPEEPAALVA